MLDASILMEPSWWIEVAGSSFLDPVLIALAIVVSINPTYPIIGRWIFALSYPMLSFAYRAGYGVLELGDYYAILPKSVSCWLMAFGIYSVIQWRKRKKAVTLATPSKQVG